jgi:sugar lactone lactonase YvrE
MKAGQPTYPIVPGQTRKRNAVLIAVAFGVSFGFCAHCLGQSRDSAGTPSGPVQIVAEIADPDASGIVVSRDGRLFLGFPRHAVDHKKATLAEYKDGKLIAFPNTAMSLPSDAPPSDRLISVHGMTTDTKDRLWVIDDGKRAGQPIPPGGAKVVGFDLKTGAVVGKVLLRPPVLRPDSHMNDLRVDLTHGAQGTAYVADSSFGTTPALVVADLATGKARRVLTADRSTQPEQGFMAFLEGRPLVYDASHPSFPVGGVDGITLSVDSKRLYWTPLTGRRLYSIATDLLADPDASDEKLGAAVVDEGERPACDGLATDRWNRIYFGAFEQDSIVRRNPDGRFELLAYDPRIIWPDGLFATDDNIYVTLGQWNRLPSFNNGRDLRQLPYLVIKVPIANP